jgi:hypothetical protein
VVGESLAAGQTVRGAWIADSPSKPEVIPAETSGAISFQVPLPESVGTKGILSASAVHYIKAPSAMEVAKKEFPTAPEGCTGGTVEHPKAEEGNLCVYAGIETLKASKFFAIERANGEEGAQRTGAVVIFEASSAEEATAIAAQGTWAVTG